MAGYYERQQKRTARYLEKVPPPTEEWRVQMMEKCAKNPEALFRDPPVQIEDSLPEFQKTEGFNEAVSNFRKSCKKMGVEFVSDEQAARDYLRSPASEGWHLGMELGEAAKELVSTIKEGIDRLNDPDLSTKEKGQLMEEIKSGIGQIFSVPDVLASAVGMNPKEFKKEFGLDDLPNAKEAEHKFLVNQVLTKYGPKSSPKPS